MKCKEILTIYEAGPEAFINLIEQFLVVQNRLRITWNKIYLYNM